MITIDSRDSTIVDVNTLIPIDVLADGMTLFHGTTNVSESTIDSHGLCWQQGLYDISLIDELLEIFETIEWVGLGGDAYTALKLYTKRVDFGAGAKKPIFLAPYPDWTVGYTRQTRAGGETAGLITFAYDSLLAFIEDENIRKDWRFYRFNHVKSTIHEVELPQSLTSIDPYTASAEDCKAVAQFYKERFGRDLARSPLGFISGQSFMPWEENLNWIIDKLNGIKHAYEKITLLREDYRYGVIYGIKLDEKDLCLIKNLNSGMLHGMAYHGMIPAVKIVAKILVSPDQHLVQKRGSGFFKYGEKEIFRG
jgi:hypothetical protein